MNTLFVETSGWACLCDADEAGHMVAAAVYREARGSGGRLVTTNFVLLELVTLLARPKRIPSASGGQVLQ